MTGAWRGRGRIGILSALALPLALACATSEAPRAASEPPTAPSPAPPLAPEVAEEASADQEGAAEGEGSRPGAAEPAPGPAAPAEATSGAPHATGGGGAEAASRPPASEPVRRRLIVIDAGGSEVRPEPGELAQRSRAARGSAPRVTNENLGEYARQGRLTVSGGTPSAEPTAATEASGDGELERGTAEVLDETYWRQAARQMREDWRRTVDEIEMLEESAADLRWRFYAEDDPWVRDGRVKPEWDRVLDRLSEARREAAEYPRRLEELVERGRRAGALPGWLREGIELEPQGAESPDEQPDPAEPIEPPAVDEDGRREPGGAGRR